MLVRRVRTRSKRSFPPTRFGARSICTCNASALPLHIYLLLTPDQFSRLETSARRWSSGDELWTLLEFKRESHERVEVLAAGE